MTPFAQQQRARSVLGLDPMWELKELQPVQQASNFWAASAAHMVQAHWP